MKKKSACAAALALSWFSQAASAGPALDQGSAWLSAIAGYTRADESNLSAVGWGGYLRSESGLIGLRARYLSGLSGLRHGREEALLLGLPLSLHGDAWAALALARFELERRSDSSGSAPVQHERLGVPLELVWAPHGRHLGLELRAEADLNGAKNSFLLGAGLQFGVFR